jgi:hypothetical protein
LFETFLIILSFLSKSISKMMSDEQKTAVVFEDPVDGNDTGMHLRLMNWQSGAQGA